MESFRDIDGDIPTKWWAEPTYISATVSFLLSLLLFVEYQFGFLITTTF